jgi:hypothetical protein
VGIMVALFFILVPEATILRAGIIPVATGLCVGKLIAGIATEAST